MSGPMLKIVVIIILNLLVFIGGSVNLPNGKVGICRNAEDCPSADVYNGLDCSCDTQVCCMDSGKAKSKCEEYGQFVYTADYGAALFTRRTLLNISQCHIEVVPLVVGGIEAKLMEFPHMAAIGFGDKPDVKYVCGGSLISQQHILTAAHCSKSQEHGIAKWAKLGAVNIEESEEFSQEYLITEQILHPRYNPPSRYNDIAIFKLGKPAEMTAYVRPACLHTEPEISVTRATATGWGKLAYVDTKGSNNLMKVELSIISGSPCEDTYKTDVGGLAMNQGIIGSQFCAGELAGGKDTCQGDSGGPLQTVLASPFCMYSIMGVTSFGKFCAFANAPAVYTRVSHYLPWIESVLWP